MSIEYGHRQEQGRRPYQEDEIVVTEISQQGRDDTHVFAVFDGHAGGRCSKFLAGALRDSLLESRSFHKSIKMALLDAYKTMNQRFLHMADKGGLNDGSTGLCVAVRGGTVTVANVGDCRVLLIGERKVDQLSSDHKPALKSEQSRIAALGGSVVNCVGGTVYSTTIHDVM
jgi:protein phosphatase 2C family protein 2/3